MSGACGCKSCGVLGVTRARAAEMLDCAPRTIDRLADSGELERFEISPGTPRISVESLHSFVQARITEYLRRG